MFPVKRVAGVAVVAFLLWRLRRRVRQKYSQPAPGSLDARNVA